MDEEVRKEAQASWMALSAWSGVELGQPLSGGHRGEVMLAWRGSTRLVVRRSSRAAESVDWELDLLEHLTANGIAVPCPVPADDGRRRVDGVMVTRFIDGRPPAGPADWGRVVGALSAVHELTRGWPQRPGFASSRELLTRDRGGDVRLDDMPARAVNTIRAAWRGIQDGSRCVAHGDISAGNILMAGGQAVLLDWDEARTDVPWFDFAFVPDDVIVPAAPARHVVRSAGLAWEAATCWTLEPGYARRRLLELYRLRARRRFLAGG